MFNGTRDVRSTIDRKQHDWSQLAEAPETNTLLADQKSYTNPKVQELLKSVHICQSYRKNKSGTLFMAHGVGWSESSANELGHYGGHPRPQAADRGTPSRSGTRG